MTPVEVGSLIAGGVACMYAWLIRQWIAAAAEDVTDEMNID
jgi:hypothetical protein